MEVCPLFFSFPDMFFVLQLLQAESPDVCVLPVITEDSFRIPQAPHEILSMRLFRSICERLCNHRPFLASSSTSRDPFLLVFSLLGSIADTCTASANRANFHALVAVSASVRGLSFLSGNRNRHLGRDSSTEFPVCPQRVPPFLPGHRDRCQRVRKVPQRQFINRS